MDNHKYALITLSNKDNIERIINIVLDNGYIIISTGGTYSKIKSYLIEVLKLSDNELKNKLKLVSEITSYPEILNGRVKTLHPLIAGGILSMKYNSSHLNEMKYYNIPYIDVVIVNLYPFKEVVNSNREDFNNAIENIDIGGHTLIRESIKNFKNTLVIVDPKDYDNITNIKELNINDRFTYAKKALNHIIDYDTYINDYFSLINNIDELDNVTFNVDETINNKDEEDNNTLIKNDESDNEVESDNDLEIMKNRPNHRLYKNQLNLKYGCNSHQDMATLNTIGNGDNPLTVLNGNLGYINILDALNGWQLVKELKEATNLSAAASFKHTSPAGVGISSFLSENQRIIYDVNNYKLSPLAVAYIKARYSDPLSSFGDFISLSDTVDECTARLIKREISDGVIAPGYTDEALNILKQKKNGNYIIIQVDPEYDNTQSMEYREIFGLSISQRPNNYKTDYSTLENIVSYSKYLSDNNKLDLILANISLKYTQSNSIAFAYNGQLIGIGAGQQNRVDCVKIAGEKARLWILMQHYKVLDLKDKFMPDIKRQERINLFIEFINNKFNILDTVISSQLNNTKYQYWLSSFKRQYHTKIIPFLNNEKEEYLDYYYKNNGICMASDAFFPFTDNIDMAHAYGVKHILHPGGSLADNKVIDLANEYNMTLIHSGTRMFYH